MAKRAGLCCLLALCVLATGASAQLTINTQPFRVLLLVDSSSAVSPFINQFRAGINGFIDGLPEDSEVGLISTGGQLRVRLQPTADRDQLHKTAAGFAQDGGANSLVDTMLEADQRFLRKATDRRPVIVILTTDEGATRADVRIDDYNKFMNDFMQRRGVAHGIVVRGRGIGPISDIVSNLTMNTRGAYEVINTATALPDKMKAIAARVSSQR